MKELLTGIACGAAIALWVGVFALVDIKHALERAQPYTVTRNVEMSNYVGRYFVCLADLASKPSRRSTYAAELEVWRCRHKAARP